MNNPDKRSVYLGWQNKTCIIRLVEIDSRQTSPPQPSLVAGRASEVDSGIVTSLLNSCCGSFTVICAGRDRWFIGVLDNHIMPQAPSKQKSGSRTLVLQVAEQAPLPGLKFPDLVFGDRP